MDIRSKRILMTIGFLLALLGVLFAFNAICIATVSTLSGSETAIIYSIISFTLMLMTLGVGSAIYWHADQSIKGKPSKDLALLPLPLGIIIFVVLLAIGLLIRIPLFFTPILLILAALPPLWAVSWFTPRDSENESQLTWRRGLVAFCGGATISVALALAAETLIPLVVLFLTGHFNYGFMDNLGDLLSGGGTRYVRLLTDPSFVFVFIQVAVIVPLIEELVKPLVTRPILRHLNRQETFWVGALAGAGFATVENIIYAASGLPIWGGILLVRALGAALHPLGSGLVALGWRAVERNEPNATETWFKHYGLAVLLHTLWNGGSLLVISIGGAQFFGELPNMDVLGFSMTGLTLAFLLILGMAALWLGRAYGHNRPLTGIPAAETDSAPDAGFALSDRATALWALTCLLALVPIGIAGLSLWMP